MNTIRLPNTSSSVRRVTTTIHDELTWGLTYRSQNMSKAETPLQPTCSPVSVHRYSFDKIVKKVNIYPSPDEKQTKLKKRKRKKEKCVNTKNLHAGAVDLLSRSILNQKQYMDILSVPNRRCFNKPKRKRQRRLFSYRCSPRIVKLAVPRKSHVLGTWKDHEYFLSTDIILRLHDLLHTDNNINLKDVRLFFKKYDKKKRKLMKLRKNGKERKKLKDMRWLQDEVILLGRLIINYFFNEPLLDLSFKQLLMSSMIIDYIGRAGNIKQPISRNVRKPFQTTIIELSDKLAVWMDTVVKFVDFQPVDDEEEFYSDISEEYPVQEEEEDEMGED
ncbi:hypothetical protein WA026_010687 [Henosepilachna vigintioctopunctata]|uniref:Uncharacterized protein n=1 Tax=Henosepilachna vigintioctopunctata TaxID=420089 RepID=A0AAW1V026_9CUCU